MMEIVNTSVVIIWIITEIAIFRFPFRPNNWQIKVHRIMEDENKMKFMFMRYKFFKACHYVPRKRRMTTNWTFPICGQIRCPRSCTSHFLEVLWTLIVPIVSIANDVLKPQY